MSSNNLGEGVSTSDNSIEIPIEEKKSETQIQSSPPPKEKMTSISVEQLLKWDKKIKKYDQENKNLKAENAALKTELVGLAKKMQQKRALDRQGLSETITQLQKILSETAKNCSKFQKERDKLADELVVEKQNKVEREKEVQSLRDVSSKYFLLKQQVNRLESELTNLRKGRDSVRNLQQTSARLEQRVVELQQQLKDNKQRIQKHESQNLTLVVEKNRLKAQLEEQEQKMLELEKEKEAITERMQVLDMEVKDFEKEREVQMRRFTAQLKELRQAAVKQLKSKQKLQQQLDRVKKQLSNRNDKYVGKSERFLAQKVQELEVQNNAMKDSMGKVAVDIGLLQQKIKQKDSCIAVLSRQISKKWPNLQQSEGLEYVEKEIVEIGLKQKINWGDIIEKVMIENLRLKHSIQTIGSQYNQELRKRKD